MTKLLAGLLTAAILSALAAVPAGATRGSRYHDATTGPYGMVVTESPAASRVGRAVLESGGNAVDAAAATVFALGVARPQSCGIGGGGFMVYRSAKGTVNTLDFREIAPAAIRADQFVGDPLASKYTGHTTVGVPGTVAGMQAALSRYGTRTLAQTIAPAERLARIGFRVPGSLSAAMQANAARLNLFAPAAAQYLRIDGSPYAAGDKLVQPELAASLRRIIRGGTGAFYRGTIARRIVADMRAGRPTADPGLLTPADFAAYRAIWRVPVRGTYRGREIIGMPPPTSGGVAIQEMLNLLEGFDLAGTGASSAQEIHLVAQAQDIAFADRGAYLADPDAVRQPTAVLVDKAYAARRRPEIDPFSTRAYGPGDVGPAARADGADENPRGSTTQVDVIDSQGNAVALTCTIEQEFGSAVVAPQTGFLLNNELTDFGTPGSANEPAPGKRPRSSMSPTIVVAGGKPVFVGGGAGGVRIIMGVLHALIGTIDFGRSLPEAVDAERWDTMGTQTLSIEDARVGAPVVDELRARGYAITPLGEYGPSPRVQLAGRDPGGTSTIGVSDSRSDHAALAQRPPIACGRSGTARPGAKPACAGPRSARGG